MRGQGWKKTLNIHGLLENQIVLLRAELMLNYVAKWDLGSIVPGLLFPTEEKKKADLWFSDCVFFQKAISVDILHLIQN